MQHCRLVGSFSDALMLCGCTTLNSRAPALGDWLMQSCKEYRLSAHDVRYLSAVLISLTDPTFLWIIHYFPFEYLLHERYYINFLTSSCSFSKLDCCRTSCSVIMTPLCQKWYFTTAWEQLTSHALSTKHRSVVRSLRILRFISSNPFSSFYEQEGNSSSNLDFF